MCDKVVYKTRKDANDAIRGMNRDKIHLFKSKEVVLPIEHLPSPDRKKRSKKTSMTSYFCNDCNAWHITTRGKKSALKKRVKTQQLSTINLKNKKVNGPKTVIVNIRNFKVK